MEVTILPESYPVNLATPQQAVTFTGFKSIEDKGLNERALLETAKKEAILGQFFENKDFDKNNGSTISFRKPGRITPRFTPLEEGVCPPPNSFSMYEYKTTIQQYGDHILFSDRLADLAYDKLVPVMSVEFGNSFREFLETKRAELLSTSKNIWFAGITEMYSTLTEFKDAMVDSTKKGVVISDLPYLTAFQTRNNVVPQVMVIPPEALAQLQSTAKSNTEYTWIDINQGMQSGAVFNGEAGKLFNIKFIVSNSIRGVEYEKSTDSTSKATLFECYLLGKVRSKWGTYESKLNGQGFPEIIYKPLGSSGVLDSLDQKGSIGWKTYYGGIVVYEEAVTRYVIKLDGEYKIWDDAERNGATNTVTYNGTNYGTEDATVESKITEPAEGTGLVVGGDVKVGNTKTSTKVTG